VNFEFLLVARDAFGSVVVLLLLALSVASWSVILWKCWVLARASADLRHASAAFWSAATLEDGTRAVAAIDRERLLLPLLHAAAAPVRGSLAATPERAQQLTRALRDALHQVLRRLQAGQVLLATVGSTAPFVGLLGTVLGIYHALLGITGAGLVSLDKISGPVAEALIMTAAGLAVAIPAVLGYNLLGRVVARREVDLEGFAHDLRELLAGGA